MSDRNARRVFRLFLMSSLMLAASAHAYAANRCVQRSPGELTLLLIPTIKDNAAPAETWWRDCLDPAFHNWSVNGSQNLPVVAAAIGMFIPGVYDDDIPIPSEYSGPTDTRVSYIDWWTDFLEAQVGTDMTAISRPGKPARTLPGALRYFHSRESFSNTYDAPVVSAVVAIHYWTQKNSTAPGASTLAGLARKYLRASWAVYAFSAGKGPTRLHRMGMKADPVTHAPLNVEERKAVAAPPPLPNKEYYPKTPLKSDGTNLFSGNFLALAGQRSLTVERERWVWDDRFPLFARALGTLQNYKSNESAPTQKALLDHLQLNWNASTGGPLYALSNSDIDKINTLIQNGSGAADLLTWLDGVRTNVTFRFLGWSDGIRASMMEKNNNGITTCIYAVKYDPVTDTTNKVATFLFTWWDNNGSNEGWARLEPGLIRAYHPAITKVVDGQTRTVHPEMEAYINIPTSTPTFHLVLSQNANPYLDGTPQVNYPPMPPPRDDWPPNF